MAAVKPRLAELSNDDLHVLQTWLVEFDRSWDEQLLASRVGEIPPGSSWRLPALAEMVKIDLRRQWLCGRRVTLESYLAEFPELGRADDVPADLIRAEYDVRRGCGSSVAVEDYLKRFPRQAAELGRLFEPGGTLMPPSGATPAPPSAFPLRSEATPAERLPEQFGRYRIIGRLGKGGMGSVYIARDTQLGRQVALKVPNFGAESGPETRQRFFREASTAATLDHPNLCPVFDAGEIDGSPYLTMAYIEGRSLADWIRTEGLPPIRVAVLLVSKLARAMQAAHARGIIHRDLKPANIMMKATGPRLQPIIVDFGLARRHDVNEIRLTRTGQIMGTIAYMAPEQIRDDRVIGPACDIYALGVILHELLTGQLPFRGSGLAVAGQILTQTPLPPSAYRPDLDPQLEAICLKAMAREVADRYASMDRLAEALSEYRRTMEPHSGSAPPFRPVPSTGDEPRLSGWCAALVRLLGKMVVTRAQQRGQDPF